MPGEPLPVGLLGGSLGGGVATVILRLLAEASSFPVTDGLCPSLDFAPGESSSLDPRSVFVGFCLGFLAWPILDFLILVRALLASAIRARLRRFLAEPYHRLL